MEKTSDMTDEEADALDEYFTRHLPKVDRSKGGVTTKAGFRTVSIDRLSENYIMTMALATNKTPTEVIRSLVEEKMAAAL